MAMKLRVLFDGKDAGLKSSANSAKGTLESVKRTAIGVAQSIGVAYGSMISAQQLIEVTKKYQRLEAQLKTATGSVENQVKAFAALKKFADDTGQDLESVTQGFTKLVNLGLDPSVEALKAYANVAAGTGKTTQDFIEAVADASVAEFERLKEFGIKAKNEGETIKFRFRGVETTVANTSEAIQGYLKQLGNEQFAGAVDEQAKTLEASIKRLGMSWDEFVYSISNSGAGALMADGINVVIDVLNEFSDLLNSGQFQAYFSAWSDQGVSAFQDVGKAANDMFIDLDKSKMLAESFGTEFNKFIIGAFENLPINVISFIKIMTVELATLVDVGGEYGAAFAKAVGVRMGVLKDVAAAAIEAFGKTIGVKMATVIENAKIYGSELLDVLNPFDGDSFDMDAALKANQDSTNAMLAAIRKAEGEKIALAETTGATIVNGYFAQADAAIEASRQAREAQITDIMMIRDATIAAFDEKKALAQEERDFYEFEKMLDQGTDLGQFSTSGGGEGGSGKGEGDTPDALSGSELQKLTESLMTKEQLMQEHFERRNAMIEAAALNDQISEQRKNELLAQNQKKYDDERLAYSNARNNLILSSSQQIFGALAGLAKEFGGEQSKAYKVMFAVQKGFAIAQGILNLSTAISNASALPFPANIPAMAEAAATGASLIQNIKGANYQGQAHDGLGRVPMDNEGTYLLRRDEMVLNPRQRENFDQLVKNENRGGGGNVVNINHTTNITVQEGSGDLDERIKRAVDQGNEELDQRLQEDFASNGTRAQLLRGAA